MRCSRFTVSLLLVTAIGALLSCAPGPDDDSGTETQVVLAYFTATVDVATGRFDVRLEPTIATRALQNIPVDRNATANDAPANHVELQTVTGTVGSGFAGCGVYNSFCATIRVKSFYPGHALRGTFVELSNVTPVTHAAMGDSAGSYGLDSSEGLWSYGNIPALGQAERRWVFAMPSSTAFTISGRVMADAVATGSVAEDCGDPGVVDEDADGDANCADSECAAVSGCLAEACLDGADDDGDGATDCADSDCGLHAACFWPQISKLNAFDGTGYRRESFGAAIAVDGDTAIVGAFYEGGGAGAAYVFTRSGSTWTPQARIAVSDWSKSIAFGRSVALSGDTVVIGAPGEDDTHPSWTNQGAAYVFTRSGSTWTQQAKFMISGGGDQDNFGERVALSGDTALIGARGNASRGAAYVFTRSGALWTQQAKLTAADAALSDQFGKSVALSGDTAVIGAYRDDAPAKDSGSAYVFTRSGSTWTQQAKMTAGDAAAYDEFGYSVALSGDTVLVGVPADRFAAPVTVSHVAGYAYVFTRSGATWTQQSKLTAADGAIDDVFGTSVVLFGDTAVIGAPGDDDAGSYSGSAYVFTRSGSTWTQKKKLAADDAAANAGFGTGVALSSDSALIGASGANIEGTVYEYAAP